KAASAIQNQLGTCIGEFLFNVALDNAFAQMSRAGQMAPGPLALFADVDQREFIATVQPLFHFINGRLADAPLAIFHELEEPRRVLFGHNACLLDSGCLSRARSAAE